MIDKIYENHRKVEYMCDAPTRHRMSSEGHSFFFFLKKLITFTLAYSYNVKHLTCIILCSSGLQNIYTSSIYGSVQHLQYLYGFTKFHIQNRPKGLPVGTYGCVAFNCWCGLSGPLVSSSVPTQIEHPC